jgi:hypothetical protein
MAYTISLIWQFLVHTRYIKKLGWLEFIFSTPSHHRVHHGKNEIYIDKNYGALFIIWDRIFGTFEPETETVEYGIKSTITTHNPVWANTHHHVHMGKLFFKTHSLKNKLKVLFGRPAFIPEDCSEPVYHNYQPQEITPVKKMYIALNFILIAVFSVLQIVHFESSRNGIEFLFSACLIMTSHAVNISLLEGKKWADTAEVLRLVFLVVSGVILSLMLGWKNGYTLALSAVLLLSLTFWVAHDYQKQHLAAGNAR